MKEREKSTGGTGVRRLPVVQIDGREYFVDTRLREFRTVTPPVRPIEFTRFDSEQGKRMLAVVQGPTSGR